MITSQVLYQLSYAGMAGSAETGSNRMARQGLDGRSLAPIITKRLIQNVTKQHGRSDLRTAAA
jgi:hypothetical protein